MRAAATYPEAKGPEVRISWVEMRRTRRPWGAAVDAESRCCWLCWGVGCPLLPLCQTGRRCHVQLIATTKQHLALRITHSALPARQLPLCAALLSASTSGLARLMNNHELAAEAIGWQQQFLVRTVVISREDSA